MKQPTIDAETFRTCLKVLNWSYSEAARQLGVHSRHRIGDWATGRRPVPPQVRASIAVHMDRALARKGV